jgi:hypothetical protein
MAATLFTAPLKCSEHPVNQRNSPAFQSRPSTSVRGFEGEVVVVPHARDSDGITAAIHHAESMQPMPAVFLPAGVYSIDRQVVVPRQMTLMGAGSGRTRLEVTVDDDAIVTPAVEYGPTGWLPVDDVVLKNFSLCPVHAGAAHHAAIAVRGCVYPRLEDIAVLMNRDRHRRFGTGIRVKAWEGVLVRCVVQDCCTGFDLSWEDAGDTINDRQGCVDESCDIELIGCRYEACGPCALPPSSLIRGAAFCRNSGVIAGMEWSSPGRFPTIIATGRAHGLINGDEVIIAGCSARAVNGTRTVTRIDATHFAVAVEAPVGGWGGTWRQEPCIRFTTADCHGLQNGAEVKVYGCQNPEYNCEFRNLRVIDDTRFRVPSAADPGAWETGGAPQAVGRVIGAYVNGSDNALIGCRFEGPGGDLRPFDRSVGLYVKGTGNRVIAGRFNNFGTPVVGEVDWSEGMATEQADRKV